MNTQLLWFATRGAGIVSLVMLTGVVYLGILSALKWQTPAWPRFATTGFHRNLALMSVAFLGVHIVTAVIDPYTSLGPLAALVPFSSAYRTIPLGLGVIALDLGAAVLVTSLLKSRMSRRAWRAVHWLSYAAWPIALAHGFGTGTDTTAPWMAIVYLASIVAVGAALLVRVTSGRSGPATTPIMAGMTRRNSLAGEITTAGRPAGATDRPSQAGRPPVHGRPTVGGSPLVERSAHGRPTVGGSPLVERPAQGGPTIGGASRVDRLALVGRPSAAVRRPSMTP